MFYLLVNGKEFVSENYESFCKDSYLWEMVKEESGFTGTGGDWRYIELCLHNAVVNTNTFDIWHGIYKPFSVPAIGFKITKE